MKSRPLRVLILLTLTALLIYSNTFSAPFLFDDIFNITENPKIRSLVHFLDPSGTRYLGFLSFALNYAMGGLNVFGYHLVNLLIHIANGFLVYSLVLLLFRTVQIADRRSQIEKANCDPRTAIRELRSAIHAQPIALLTALIFIVHPIQTQAVTYIVQRFASLVTLFYLLAVVCYLKWRLQIPPHPPFSKGGDQKLPPLAKGGWGGFLWYLASLASTLLAMKTKENSLTIPLTILLVEVIFFRPLTRRRWLTLLPFLPTLLIVPLSYYEPLKEAAPLDVPDLSRLDVPDLSSLEYLFTQFRVIVTYLRLLVLPINQSLDYDYPVYHSLFEPAVLVSFLFLSALFGLAIFLLRRRPHQPRSPITDHRSPNPVPHPLIAFGILWFFLTLSVESSIFPIKDVIFEHRVYLPSVGFFLGVSVAGGWLWQNCKKTKHLTVLFVLLVLFTLCTLAMATYRRNFVWRSAVTLWEDVTQKAPNKARGYVSLGVAYRAEGRLAEAIREFKTALRLNPEYPAGIHDNLGVVYTMQGALPEAIREYQIALQLNPDDAEIHNNMGVALRDQGREEDAIAEYREALRLNPDHPEAHNNLGLIHKAKGRADEAMREFETAVRLNPDYAEAHGSLGIVYGERGRLQEAIVEFQSALRLKPDFVEARANLGTVYQAMGLKEEARREFEETLKINPGFKAAREALDSLLQRSK